MIALVGAMFVAMGSVSAAAVGACSDDSDAPTMLGIGDTCTIAVVEDTTAVKDPIDTDPDGNVDTAEKLSGEADQIQSADDRIASVANAETDDDGGFASTVTAVALGKATITVNDYTEDDAGTEGVDEEDLDTDKYYVSVSAMEVTKIEFGSGTGTSFKADSDGIFSAGTDVTARVTVSYSNSTLRAYDDSTDDDLDREVGALDVTLTVPSTGLSIDGGTGQRQTMIANNAAGDSASVTVDFALITDGAPSQVYEVTAQAVQARPDTNADDDTDDSYSVTTKKLSGELTVGDSGDRVAGASLELGLKEGAPDTDATNDMPESGTAARDKSVNLALSITNGIDNPVNAADVEEIRVVAPFGVVKYYMTGGTLSANHNNGVSPSAVSKGSVIINVASSDQKPRTIDVYAIVLGKAGVATTGTVSLNFTGDAASVDIENATENLRSINLSDEMDSVKLMVTAADSSGNTAEVPDRLTITVHDPEDKQLAITGSDRKISAEQMSEAGKTFIKVTNLSGNDASTALKAGEYTVKVKSGTIDDSAMFTVVGTADSIDVEVGETNDNGEFEVTVTAKDAVGKLVADGTPVMVEAPDLRGDADKVLFLARSDGKTTAGMAKAKLVEIGPGNAAIVVTVDGVTKVERYTSTYGAEAEAMPEPETVGTHCIRNQGGFATWTCGVEAMASEVFALVSPEGATAIHLWSTISLSWVRYSVVEGVTVPGSSDFMVAENDILYISN